MKRGIAYILLCLIAVQSCTVYNKTPVSIQQAVASGKRVKVVSHPNQIHVFDKIVFADSTYFGMNGRKKTLIYENAIRGIYAKNPGKSAARTTVVAVAAAGVLLIAECNCPHVYVDNGSNYELNTTLYTGAIAPQLERHDYKILPAHQKDPTAYEIKIANEDNEDQYTNLLELITIDHNENVSVLSDRNGTLFTIKNAVEPVEALDNNLHTIRDQVKASDDDAYRFDAADSVTGLSDAFLTFGKPGPAVNGKLILRVKNSNWSGYVYDEFNSLFGKRHAEWVKSNENKSKEEREEWMADQGINLLVDIKTDKGWQSVDRVELVGDVSYHSIVIPLELEPSNSNIELRLRAGFKFWELDYAAMDFSEDSPVGIQRLKPVFATGPDDEDFADALSSDDSKYMEHLGRGSLTLVRFETMPLQEGKSRTIMIHSKGYYLSNKKYEGKTQTKEIVKFRNPGELSRFSKTLHDALYTGITQN